MLDHFASKAKAYCALVGAVATALLGTYQNQTLALVAAVCTAVATYAVPNTDAPTEGD